MRTLPPLVLAVLCGSESKNPGVIGALSPLGVLAGVAASNLLPERALQLAFAALALFMAAHLVRRARATY